MRAFRRTSRGIEAWLGADERALLRGLGRELLALLDDGNAASADPALARLLPDAYGDDDEAAHEFRRLTEGDLRESKRLSAQALVDLAGDEGTLLLDDASAEQWLLALNDLRLALGVRLGVTEETYDELPDDLDDEAAQGLALYDVLTWLQGSLVDAVDVG